MERKVDPETNVRAASLEDLDALTPLFDAYRQFYRQPEDRARARSFLQARMQANECTIFVASKNAEIIGFCLLYPLFSSVQTTRVFVLNDLYVSAAARREGVGSALLDAAERFAVDHGAPCLLLETEAANTTAQALYEHRGWRRDGCYHYVWESSKAVLA